jgi:hypothetical protein
MSNKNLSIDLHQRVDGEGKIFYVGKLEFPGNIKCDDGITFLIFTADVGAEQLQICKIDNKKERK